MRKVLKFIIPIIIWLIIMAIDIWYTNRHHKELYRDGYIKGINDQANFIDSTIRVEITPTDTSYKVLIIKEKLIYEK